MDGEIVEVHIETELLQFSDDLRGNVGIDLVRSHFRRDDDVGVNGDGMAAPLEAGMIQEC